MAGEDTDTRDVTAPAISDSEMPASMSKDEAASLLEGSLDALLGLTKDDDEGDDDGDTDQGSDQSNAGDDDDETEDETSDDDQGDDDQSAEDDEDDGDDDQGDDQSEDEPETDSPTGLFTRNEKGKLVAADPADIELIRVIDGEEQTLTVQDLEDGYMRQIDYTRKTQNLAKTVNTKVDEGLEEGFAKLDERGIELDAIIETFTGLASKSPDFGTLLARHNGDGNAAQREFQQIEALRSRLDQARTAVKERDERAKEKAARDVAKNADRTVEIIRDTVPGLKSEAGFKRTADQMSAYLTGIGLSRDEILGGVLQNPAYVEIVLDAMHGKNLKNKKQTIRDKRVKSTKRTRQRPTGTPSRRSEPNDLTQIRKRAKAGDEKASLKLLENLL